MPTAETQRTLNNEKNGRTGEGSLEVGAGDIRRSELGEQRKSRLSLTNSILLPDCIFFTFHIIF